MDTVQKAPAGQPVSDPWQHARSHAAKASELLAAAPECHCGDPENCPYEVPQASIAAIAHAHATTGLLYAAIGRNQSGGDLLAARATAQHRIDYVAPFTPADQCDHDGPASCTRCCPCRTCGSARAAEVLAGEHVGYIPTVADTGGDPADTSPDPGYQAIAHVREILADHTLGASVVIEMIGQAVAAARSGPEARDEPGGYAHA
jgi:hypothetical protein